MIVLSPSWSRRRLVGVGLTALASSLLPEAGWARTDERRLKFRHLHTGERLDIVYFRSGAYQPEQLLAADRFLRDFRTGQSIRMDHRLFDFLSAVQTRLGAFGEYEILGGYRSRATNDLLRRRSHGVAKNSLHIVGKAIDMNLAGASLKSTRGAALDLALGGVGYYPRSNFVHLDTGPVRTWRG